MGCFNSKPEAVYYDADPVTAASAGSAAAVKEYPSGVSAIKRPTWRADPPMTAAALQRKRDEFWETQPYYGGSKEIWDALRAACAADASLAKVLLDAAEVKVTRPDMSVCYDARGFRYELPQYVVADPSNLLAE
jgi:hypothetical protein